MHGPRLRELQDHIALLEGRDRQVNEHKRRVSESWACIVDALMK